jgi:predicted SnoaL-like aldol condensation-catalyzing enzyme
VQAQRSDTSQTVLEKNKDLIEQFFLLADKGDVDKLRPLISVDFIEHASYAPDGRDALLRVVSENVRPNDSGVRQEKSEVIRMLAEGDQVWVYTRVTSPGTTIARVNMFRVEGGRTIAEHWAVQEVVNLQRANANDQWAVGMGSQNAATQPKRVTKVVSHEQLERNKEVMRKFFLYSESSDPAERIKLLDWATTGPGGYIQHNANGQDGIEGFAGARRGGPAAPGGRGDGVAAGARGGRGGGPLPHHMLVRALAEGDYVWCLNIPDFARGSAQMPERANFNQWRLENGKLAEHWGTYETVQPNRANTNDFLGFGRTQTRDLTR